MVNLNNTIDVLPNISIAEDELRALALVLKSKGLPELWEIYGFLCMLALEPDFNFRGALKESRRLIHTVSADIPPNIDELAQTAYETLVNDYRCHQFKFFRAGAVFNESDVTENIKAWARGFFYAIFKYGDHYAKDPFLARSFMCIGLFPMDDARLQELVSLKTVPPDVAERSRHPMEGAPSLLYEIYHYLKYLRSIKQNAVNNPIK